MLKIIFILDNNKIKFINSQTFSKLLKLKSVWLENNDCINRNFFERAEELSDALEENCSFSESFSSFKCGEVSYVRGLMINGTKAGHGDWPFLVTLRLNEPENSFFCAGNLISKRHVLTGRVLKTFRVIIVKYYRFSCTLHSEQRSGRETFNK